MVSPTFQTFDLMSELIRTTMILFVTSLLIWSVYETSLLELVKYKLIRINRNPNIILYHMFSLGVRQIYWLDEIYFVYIYMEVVYYVVSVTL